MFHKRWLMGCQQAVCNRLCLLGEIGVAILPNHRPRLEVLEDRAVPAILWNEAVDGDLSDNQSVPTPLVAELGTNSVLGTVGGTPALRIG